MPFLAHAVTGGTRMDGRACLVRIRTLEQPMAVFSKASQLLQKTRGLLSPVQVHAMTEMGTNMPHRIFRRPVGAEPPAA